MYFIKKFIDPKNILVIEIWTYKVKIACCQYKNNEITVLWYAEQRQEHTNIISWEIASIEWVWETIEACLEKLYKEIRSYIKNISSNELVASSENKKYQKTIKSLYYSKNALIWLNNNKDHEFVQFKDGLVRFIPQ